MTDEELIHWLRVGATKAWEKQAADRIEALVKQLAEADALIEAQAKDHASNNIRLAETAYRAERLEAALRELVTCVEDGCFCSEMKMATAIDEARAALEPERKLNDNSN